jgi:CRP-like cAMP-binding protein
VRYTAHLRKIAHDEEQKLQAINVLKNSTRGQRSTMEKEILRRFVLNNLSCIPKSISFTEMDTLCNELDWYPLIGRSIIFLQGDFGNVYYMIASGTIGLYLEPSKDREMVIAREFGNLRAQSFPGSDEDLKALGNNILNLPVRNMKLSLPYCFQIGIAKYYIERRRIWRVCDLSDYK